MHTHVAVDGRSLPELEAALARIGQQGLVTAWVLDRIREPVVLLGALAKSAQEFDIRLGLDWSLLGDRPALSAWKQVVTLDHLTGGRISLLATPNQQSELVSLAANPRFEPASVQLPHPPCFDPGAIRRRVTPLRAG